MPDAQLPVASIISTATRIVRQVEEETQQVNRFTAPDFSPFRFINQGEVATTRLLAYFLDASESHGQGRLFQDLFIDQLRALTKVSSNLPRLSWSVQVEKRIVNVGQIDLLLIAEDGFRICIENKPRDQTVDQYRLRWSSKNSQWHVLSSTAHARQNTSERLAADPQEIHAGF